MPSDLAELEIPSAVAAVAAGRPVRPVWQNRFGGQTWEVGTGSGRCFVKWAPAASRAVITAEAARLAWAWPFTPVPRVLAEGGDEYGSWLVTSPVEGESAASGRWRAEPRTAVRAVGEGLRAMHESLPSASCPFSWSAQSRLAEIYRQLSAGSIAADWWPGAGGRLRVGEALDLLAATPPADLLVVCHGDSCAPNTLLDGDGRWCGHVDLGDLGVADRWADLAIATWSADLNYGPGWQGELLAAYGIGPDPERTRYYRLLGRCYDPGGPGGPDG